jgi:ATP-dependent helicase/nuclease subunit A
LLALKHPDYFKYILAVTFANKSSQEMKDRVIQYLGDFAKGEGKDLALEIQKELNIDEPSLRDRSKEVLTRILHQYSHFSISTIDAFFQKVIRAFTRESGLLGNFRLEAEIDPVLNEVIALLIDELGDGNQQLTDWVIEFSRDRLADGESWNITDALKGFAREIFKEDFKAIAADVQQVAEKISMTEFSAILRKEKAIFMNFMKGRGKEAMEIMKSKGITANDFSYKDIGTAYKYFKVFAQGTYMEAGSRIVGSAEGSGNWPAKKGGNERLLIQLAEQQLIPILKEMLEYDQRNFIKYNTVDLVEKNFYSYGLISDITRILKEYKAENNLMLLSDASLFLNGVINNSDTPFIYEKVGSFYRHYLIDEFQDTSELQWKNFQPLLRDAVDQQHRSIVVGDVKQSIYRWRGGDLGLLQHSVEEHLGSELTEKHVLEENWRSAENLVRFNNTLFSEAARQVSLATSQSLPAEAFSDIRQIPVKYKGKGFIRVEFLEKWNSREEDNGENQALNKVPGLLEELQEAGVRLQDIAILVRKNEEGQRIANFLLKYKDSPQAKPGARYEVVSNESLRLDAASSVLLLISALKYLNNPDDPIARGELVYEYFSRTGNRTPEELEACFAAAGRKRIKDLLPEEFTQQQHWFVKLSLFELTETLIRVFGLGTDEKELAYIESFQDFVLEFSGQEKSDIASFLEWWEEMKGKRSIQVAANTDAVSIYTIHKAKGLQFKYVIVPFCSWSMNHDKQPLLWCKSPEKPFDELGYVAVRYNSSLKKSFFAKNYEEEFTKAYLDNLNLLYVACTRAEEGLIVLAPKGAVRKNEEDKINTAGQLLFDSILQTAELNQNYDPGKAVFVTGKIERLSMPEGDGEYLPVSLTHYPAFDWRQKLVIKREGTEFFREEKTEQRQRINYGILMHRTLSMIHYKDDLPTVLEKLNFEGVIMEEEMGLLKERIGNMLSHPVIGNWFSKEWQVRTEAPVIIPGGQPGRLDRVIFKEVSVKNQVRKKAVIIDFKTGEKKKEDRIQVENYSSILSKMGYVDVEAYLLYLETLETVLVVDKTNLSLF